MKKAIFITVRTGSTRLQKKASDLDEGDYLRFIQESVRASLNAAS